MKKFSSRWNSSYKPKIIFGIVGFRLRHDFYAHFNMGRFRIYRVCTKHPVCVLSLTERRKAREVKKQMPHLSSELEDTDGAAGLRVSGHTVNSTSDYTLWTLYRSYFKGISANIELQIYSLTCCWSYIHTRGISDILPRRFTTIPYLWGILQTSEVVSP
jgi:hypothetical protein